MTRLDARQRAPMEPGEELRDAARTAQDYLRRWIGVPADSDTGERAPVRQRVPA